MMSIMSESLDNWKCAKEVLESQGLVLTNIKIIDNEIFYLVKEK